MQFCVTMTCQRDKVSGWYRNFHSFGSCLLLTSKCLLYHWSIYDREDLVTTSLEEKHLLIVSKWLGRVEEKDWSPRYKSVSSSSGIWAIGASFTKVQMICNRRGGNPTVARSGCTWKMTLWSDLVWCVQICCTRLNGKLHIEWRWWILDQDDANIGFVSFIKQIISNGTSLSCHVDS